MFILRVAQVLDDYRVDYAVAGGFAVALHGAVRGTLDVDLVLVQTETNYARAEEALHSIGLQARLPVTAKEVCRFRKEYILKRNMIAWSFYNPNRPSEIVDVLITRDLRKMKARSIFYGRYRIKILSLQDLIRMKKESNRPQDRADVEALQEIRRRHKRGKKK